MSDGEAPDVDPSLVDSHLRTCSGCRSHRERLERLRRDVRVGVAPQMVDLSRRVARLNAMADRASRWGVLRVLLAVVAAEIMVLSIPDLVLSNGGSVARHATRHLGAFAVAYAVGLLMVVVRPSRARSMLPVACVLVGALVVTGLVDVFEGRIPLVGEAAHLPEVLSVVLVWLVSRPSAAPVPPNGVPRRGAGDAAGIVRSLTPPADRGGTNRGSRR